MPECSSTSTTWCYAVHSLKTGLMTIHPDGTIDKINQSLKRMFSSYGAPSDFEWKGISFFDLSPTLFQLSSFGEFFETVYLPSLKDVIQGATSNYSAEYSIDWNGKTIWILGEIYPLEAGLEGSDILVSFTNITRYKQRELFLKQVLAYSCSAHGHVPICAVCKHVRTDEIWEPIEIFLENRISIDFTHDICPSCIRKVYPEYSMILDDPHMSTKLRD